MPKQKYGNAMMSPVQHNNRQVAIFVTNHKMLHLSHVEANYRAVSLVNRNSLKQRVEPTSPTNSKTPI